MARSGKPYIWVTWITGLLAGTELCAYPAWLKAKHGAKGYKKTDSEPQDWSEYQQRHDQMVADRVLRLRSEGYEVLVEDQNSFVLEGQTAKIGGKPDIIALKKDQKYALVVDAKSGKAKEKYIWQVKLYQFASKLGRYKDYIINGEVEYKDASVPVPDAALSAEDRAHIGRIVQMISGDTPPPKMPSRFECQYCDVADCDKRFKEAPTAADRYF